jgi:prephenate dehydrogenase
MVALREKMCYNNEKKKRSDVLAKIAVIGLGIIGGSICAALSKAGYIIDGADLREETIEIARQKGYVREKAQNISDYDVVFIAVPPKATISVLENTSFKDGAIVTDICGIKYAIEKTVFSKPRNYRYVGIHPMAGKETSGIDSASPDLFNNANLVITLRDDTDKEALLEIKKYATAMRFGRIVECSAEEHDKKIALTSQLAHIVSNAYVKSPQVSNCKGFTGGSFQDMTRIAGVDETVWTPLYACNRENVLNELSGLISHLQQYYDALKSGDDEQLSRVLREGRVIRENIKRENKKN